MNLRRNRNFKSATVTDDHRSSFDEHLNTHFQINTIEHWNQRIMDLAKYADYPDFLHHYHQGSLQQALKTVYPEYEWQTKPKKPLPYSGEADQFTEKKKSPRPVMGNQQSNKGKLLDQQSRRRRYLFSLSFWQIEKHRSFFDDYLNQQLQITSFHQWSERTAKDVHAQGGGTLLSNYYGDSLHRALETIYPEYNWQFAERHPDQEPQSYGEQSQPPQYSQTEESQREFDHNQYHWTKQRAYFDRRLTIKFKNNDEKQHTIIQTSYPQADVSTTALLDEYYDGSLSQAIDILYPEYDWEFNRTHDPELNWQSSDTQENPPRGYWHTIENQRSFFDNHLNKKLQITQFHQWDQRRIKGNISDHGLNSLLTNYYNSSLRRALDAIYPEYQWTNWSSGLSEMDHCAIENHRCFFDNYLNQKFQISSFQQWNQRTSTDLAKPGASASFLDHYYDGSLKRALETVYPEYDWRVMDKNLFDYWQKQRAHFDKRLAIRFHNKHTIIQRSYPLGEPSTALLLEQCYAGSLSQAIDTLYPEYDWAFSSELRAPDPDAISNRRLAGVTENQARGLWQTIENQRSFFHHIAQRAEQQYIQQQKRGARRDIAYRTNTQWWLGKYLKRHSQFWNCYCNMRYRDGYDFKSPDEYISTLYPEYSFVPEDGELKTRSVIIAYPNHSLIH